MTNFGIDYPVSGTTKSGLGREPTISEAKSVPKRKNVPKAPSRSLK